MRESPQYQLPIEPRGWGQGPRTTRNAIRRAATGELRTRIVAALLADPYLLRGVQTNDVKEKFNCTYDLAYRAIKRARAQQRAARAAITNHEVTP